MDIQSWDERYKTAARPREDLEAPPTPLVVRIAEALRPANALDLACGAGRNALWLAERGWKVTAVDGSASAINILRTRARERGLDVVSRVADLEAAEYKIAPAVWDLILIAYYLQQDLIESAKAGLKPGGVIIVIVHITAQGEEPTKHRLLPGELIRHFQGWETLHCFEGQPEDAAHRRAVAEIVARRPDETLAENAQYGKTLPPA
jgi:tellurite methyltransferase